MATQVVLSRMQNRRGTQAEFDALYISGAPVELQLQPGEVGFCTDTHRLFIGNDIPVIGNPYTYTEIPTAGQTVITGSTLEFSPIIISLLPAASWTDVTSLAFTPDATSPHPGLLNIFYTLTELSPLLSTDVPFTKSGILSVATTTYTSSSAFIPVSKLTDTGTEINTYLSPQPDISFKAEYSGGTVQIYYKHNFSGSLELSTSTIHWINF